LKVEEVMTKSPFTLRSDQTLREAAVKLADMNVSGAPVVNENGEILGVLSEVDILEALKTHYKALRMLMPPEITFGISFVEVVKERDAVRAFQELKDVKVKDVMKKPITVSPDDKVENAIKLMVEHRISRVPVIENKRVVGIVTRGDVLKGFFRQIGQLVL
jgi:CBS domain-containing protein